MSLSTFFINKTTFYNLQRRIARDNPNVLNVKENDPDAEDVAEATDGRKKKGKKGGDEVCFGKQHRH